MILGGVIGGLIAWAITKSQYESHTYELFLQFQNLNAEPTDFDVLVNNGQTGETQVTTTLQGYDVLVDNIRQVPYDILISISSANPMGLELMRAYLKQKDSESLFDLGNSLVIVDAEGNPVDLNIMKGKGDFHVTWNSIDKAIIH